MMYLGKEFATEIPAAFHDEFMTEAAELLDEYGWENTTYGLERIYATWKANKSRSGISSRGLSIGTEEGRS